MHRIDLNCDMGESADPERLSIEERLMPLVTSVSIACGFHAGNPDLMRRTIRLARAHGVAIGAHPGFRDPEGLGRRELDATPEAAENLIAYQIGALAGIAVLEGAQLSHVKPHGALYNMAARDRRLADAIARAVARVDRRLILFGLAGSELVKAGRTIGLTVTEEAFVDRAYNPDGSLVPRGREGAVIQDEQEVVARVRRLVREGAVASLDGQLIRLHADTICLHSDTSGADRLVGIVRRELTTAGVKIEAIASAGEGRRGRPG
ncbi:MAG: LamB/YcsF family protein [Nitrospiraceae bacterium]